MPDLHIGISGWTYAPWRGVFYPLGLTQKRELEFASRAFSSIEINGTFYSNQRPTSWAKWAGETPDDFVFSIKGGRFITHIRRLRECRSPLANFFAQGLLTLGPKLGPILWQLPPTLKFDAGVIEPFLALLPHDTDAAAALASEHDDRMKGKVAFHVETKRAVRHAIEVRHESFRDPAFVELLRKHRVALVVADTAGRYPLMEDVTADFVYCRLHGDEALYSSGYTDAALDAWTDKIKAWSKGGDAPQAKLAGPAAAKRASRDVYAYFDNDVKVHSPFDASGLAHRLGLNKAAIRPATDLEAIDDAARKAAPPVKGGGKKQSAKARSMSVSHKRKR